MKEEYQKPVIELCRIDIEDLLISLSLEPKDDIIVGAKGNGFEEELSQDDAISMQQSVWDE